MTLFVQLGSADLAELASGSDYRLSESQIRELGLGRSMQVIISCRPADVVKAEEFALFSAEVRRNAS